MLASEKEILHVKRELSAFFPKELLTDVEEVLKILPYNNHAKDILGNPISHLSENRQKMYLNNEELAVYYRVYLLEPNPKDEEKLSSIQKLILHCIYSRHSNGWIREKHLNFLFTNEYYFTAPFIIHLAGEYLIELLTIIYVNISNKNLIYLTEFIKENPKFWALSKNRILSYWNEFYRSKFNSFEDYIGKKIINKLEYNK